MSSLDLDRIDERKLWSLLTALLAIFLLYPLAVELGILRLYRLALILVLGLATFSVSGNRSTLRIALALAVPSVVGQVVAASTSPGLPLVMLFAFAGVAFFGFTILVILRLVFRPGEVTSERIAGAVSVYLLAGLLWAILYVSVYAWSPAAFDMPETAHRLVREGGEFAFVYYSFVTQVSLGYGEITPTSPLAQTLAWMQAVAGQLYIAILLARLVSLHVSSRGGATDSGAD